MRTRCSPNTLKVVAAAAHPYLREVMSRYAGNPQVVAVDLANELREPADTRTLDARMTDLMAVYHDLIRTARSVDADKVLILQPFYGNTRVSAAQLGRVRSATTADPAPVAANFTNLIWSYHDYYTGSGSGDGYSTSGYASATSGVNGVLTYSHSWDGASCYPTGSTAGCPDSATARTGTMVPRMTTQLAVHQSAANGAAMALLVGEFGVPHPALDGSPLGWGGGDRLIADKVGIYKSQGVSRMYWAFSVARDETYGLYNFTVASPWYAWTTQVLG